MELDLEAYDTLEFRVRVHLLAERARGSELRRGSQGDGRKYVATLRTDAWINVPVRGWHLPHADGLC